MIHHQAVTLILQNDDFTNRRGNQQTACDEVVLDFCDDFLLCFAVRIPGGVLRCHTGIVVKCLVSNQKEHATAL